MSKVDTSVAMDSSLLDRLDNEARRSGRTRDELIEDSLRRTLAGQVLAGIFARVRPVSALTDDQAEAIAYRELDAVRSEGDPLQSGTVGEDAGH
ncbi:MAG: CopG family transcriptional regulator [Geodermatophilaceae bacterium]|jgi:hypothetical protein